MNTYSTEEIVYLETHERDITEPRYYLISDVKARDAKIRELLIVLKARIDWTEISLEIKQAFIKSLEGLGYDQHYSDEEYMTRMFNSQRKDFVLTTALLLLGGGL